MPAELDGGVPGHLAGFSEPSAKTIVFSWVIHHEFALLTRLHTVQYTRSEKQRSFYSLETRVNCTIFTLRRVTMHGVRTRQHQGSNHRSAGRCAH